MTSRLLRALSSELWAIEPSWLHLLAAVAQRNTSAPEVEAAREWIKRDYALMAGPGAQKLACGFRAYVVDGVAVLPVTGPIFPRANLITEISGGTSLAILANDYAVALNAREVGAIMLLIDSPGGAVSGVADFANRVASGTGRKETHAFVTGVAASAAYWIASAASKISIDRSAMLGSIGVVAAVPKQVSADQDGYLTIEVVSSNAPNKRPDPQSDDGLNVIREQIDALERIFVSDVARGRKTSSAKVIQDFGKGGVLVGAAALTAGMADRVGSQTTAMNMLKVAARFPGRVGAMSKTEPWRSAASYTREEQNRANLARLAALRR